MGIKKLTLKTICELAEKLSLRDAEIETLTNRIDEFKQRLSIK